MAEKTIHLSQALKFDHENKNRILKQRNALHTELTVCILAQHQDAAFDDDICVVQFAALEFAKLGDDEYVEAYMGECVGLYTRPSRPRLGKPSRSHRLNKHYGINSCLRPRK